MRCLALDSSTDISSIAVTDGPEVLAEHNFLHRMDLSRRLMPNIVGLLRDCRLAMGDLEAVGVSLGPGSFTGLRIGVVTAKTLAQTLGIPIAGIVTLDLLARQFDYLPGALVCPLIKVRKGEVYYAFYRTGGGSVERLTEYDAGPIEDVVKLLEGEWERAGVWECGGPGSSTPRLLDSSRIIFCGDALAANLPVLREALVGRVIEAPQWLSYPKASTIARLAVEKIEAGEASDPFSLVPYYIRRSAPEMRLDDSCR